MSVLACQRRGCENIMCDRYSYEYGYICDDCFTELVSLGVETNIDFFMESTKIDINEDNEDMAFIRFDRVFSN